MDKAVVLLLTAILLFIAGFLVAIYLSYKKIKELEKKNINLYNELKNITSQTDFIYYFRELVGIINTQVDLNTVISNISKIIFNALSLNENEGVVFFLHNSEKKNFDFLHSYPETIKSISLQTNLLNTITTKTEILHNDTLFLIYPIYFEGKLINFLILMLKPEGKDFDTKLKDIEYKVEELIRFISLGFKTPMYYEGAVKDSFTGLYNKIHFENELKTFFELSRRENIPLSLIILDIDDFKKINDTYGHFIGDKVIKEVTSIIKNSIRNYNLPYRVGGEE
ncbi:MAG: GGDEF domain-containing protein, partial [Planctomycetota bacterium]